MPTAEANTVPTGPTQRPTARILQFKQALREKTAAVGDWATGRAGAVHDRAAQRPLATAGILAGAAFVGGVTLGLLLGRQLNSFKVAPVQPRLFDAAMLRSRAAPYAARARSLLRM
jgi:hypothetical protein